MKKTYAGNLKIREAVGQLLPETGDFLEAMIKFPSTPGQEHELICFLDESFRGMDAEVERVPFPDGMRKDPDYSDPISDIRYDGRFNLRVMSRGSGKGRRLLFNTHADVVPASEGMPDAWSPRREGDQIYGRGACDAKGQIALFRLVMRTIERLGIKLDGKVIGHLVNEEENGGNGSLAMVRRGEQADACIVLEPTEQRLLSSIRGAVWFKINFFGVAGHSGAAARSKSALLLARTAMNALEEYHARLLSDSRGIELFDRHQNPMPLTFGKLHAGNWPAAAPSHAVLEGVLGFLPNRSKEQICSEMNEVLLSCGLAKNEFELSFMYRHDCSVLEPDHFFPKMMQASAVRCGRNLEIDAMTASCDAWLYRNMLKIPTVVFGPGTLGVAHSKNESIGLNEIAAAAETLSNFIIEFCGGK